MFDVDSGSICAGAELIFIMDVDKLGADNIWLVVSPVVWLKIVIELFFVRPDELVLVYLLSRTFVLKHTVVSVVFPQLLLGQIGPFLSDERRTLDTYWKITSHWFNYQTV